jgi:hypothetical protein
MTLSWYGYDDSLDILVGRSNMAGGHRRSALYHKVHRWREHALRRYSSADLIGLPLSGITPQIF